MHYITAAELPTKVQLSYYFHAIQDSFCCRHTGRGGSRIFFRRGCTRPFNTNNPHSFFFCRIPVVLENRRSSQGEGGYAPLHSPPRSAPDGIWLLFTHKNADFGAISVMERSCCTPVSKAESHNQAFILY